MVGKNGAGKSTMLKILAGLQNPTRGVVAVPKDVTIGYLPQVMILSDVRTVMEEAELAFEHIFELQANLERMNQQLADRTDYESEEYHQLIDRFTHENDRFLMMGGTNFQAEIERTLLGLGFSREDFNRSTSEFSGGWRMRIELAKLLLRRPDVLLLDEPTNDLDIQTLTILEDYLDSFDGIIITVSHDRYFLDRTVNRIFSFEGNGVIRQYEGGYSDYLIKKEIESVSEEEKQEQKTEKVESKSKETWKQREKKLKFTYKEQREFETIDEDIAKLESKLEKLDQDIMKNATNSVKLSELMKEKEEAEQALEDKMDRWVYLNDLNEKIQGGVS